MEINYWKDKKIKENPQGLDAREVYHTEYAQIMHLKLEPGETVKPHKSPIDVIFIVMEGTAEFHIGEESQTARTEAIIHSPANIPHAIDNLGASTLRILVMKTPSPVMYKGKI